MTSNAQQPESQENERQKVDSFCGYCGTSASGVKVRVKTGDVQNLLCDEETAEMLMKAKDSGRVFWIKVCPACGFAVGVIQ